ncbi:MAG TPA: hypothetical protein VKB92_01160 [Myxococcales bacterium]|nr:hypothetical protein [Myxococcales bacterium]
MKPAGQAGVPRPPPVRSRHGSCKGRSAMGQLIEVFAEGLERLGLPLLGMVLWSLRSVLFALLVLGAFGVGFRLGFAAH